MRKSFKFLVCQLGVMALSLFVIIGCSRDDDTEPKFKLNLEVYPNEAGNVTGAGEYYEEAQVAIEATAAEGYMFVEWTGDVEHVNNAYSATTTITMPARNISLTSVFAEGSLMDVDRNVYQTVIIDNLEWMAENLRVTRYNNEDDILSGLIDEEWENTTEGAFAVYPHEGGGVSEDDVEGINSDEEMVAAYGKLYNWYAVDDPRGLCPEGWSVPSDEDWTELVDYIADLGFPNSNVVNGAANSLKSCRQVNSPLEGCNTLEHPRWNADFTHHGSDELGFSALPGGDRWADGRFTFIGGFGFWWSSSEQSSTNAWLQFISRNNGRVTTSYGSKNGGYSIRCVRDLVPPEDE